MYKYELANLDKLLAQFDEKIVLRAQNDALNKALTSSRTHISKAVRQVYNVKASAVSKRVKVIRSRKDSPQAALIYKGPKIGLINFAPRVKDKAIARKAKLGKGRPWGRIRKQVTVKITKNSTRQVAASKKGIKGFVARGANANEQIFARRSDDRDDLVALKVKSIPEMVAASRGGAGNLEAFEQHANEVYRKEFDRRMSVLLGDNAS